MSQGARPNTNVHAPPVVRYTPNVFGFPDRMLTKLRYGDVFNITGTSGALGSYIFRWNSTFDPDFTGTGHQPLYRDTYAAIYAQYAVTRAYAKITVINPSNSYAVVCGVVTDDDTSLSGNFNVLMEQSHGKKVLLTPLSGSKSSHIFEVDWDCKSVLNIDPYSSELYKTAVGSNPTETSTLGVWLINEDGTNTVTCNFIIELIQEVLWTELITPTIN